MQISRLFEIVYMLINKKHITAKELAEHFEVSQRTIYRDIDILSQSGIPIYTVKGKGGGISLMENFILNKSLLTDKEQRDILSALQGLKATNYTDSDQVLSKLSYLFGDKNADWIEVDFSNWNSNEEDIYKFNLLKEAILSLKVVHFHYSNSKGEEAYRIVEPRKLIFKGQAWYLLGFCREKKDYRYFKITRINTLTISNETFVPTSLEKLSDLTQEQPQIQMMDLLLKIDSQMSFRIFDEFPKEAIEKTKDGHYLVHARLMGGTWLIGYLMSYEDYIEVIKPVELRKQLLTKYENLTKKYKYDV